MPCCLLEWPLLVLSAMEDVENICYSPGMAVVGQVFPGRKASHAGGDVLRGPTGVGVFAQQPETLRDAVHQAVCDFQPGALCPIQKNLVEILLRGAADTIAHHWPEASWARSLRPLAFALSASFFSPSRPSYSVYSPASMDLMPARTQCRMPASCSAVKSETISSALGLARRTARVSSSSILRKASRTTSLALLYLPLFTFLRTYP